MQKPQNQIMNQKCLLPASIQQLNNSNINTYLLSFSSLTQYQQISQAKQLLQLMAQQPQAKINKTIINKCSKLMKSQIFQAKVSSLKFIKQSIEILSFTILDAVIDYCLDAFIEVIQYRSHIKSINRGSTFLLKSVSRNMSEEDTNMLIKLSNSFFRMAHECVLVWGNVYFPDSKFGSLYKKLYKDCYFPEYMGEFKFYTSKKIQVKLEEIVKTDFNKRYDHYCRLKIQASVTSKSIQSSRIVQKLQNKIQPTNQKLIPLSTMRSQPEKKVIVSVNKSKQNINQQQQDLQQIVLTSTSRQITTQRNQLNTKELTKDLMLDNKKYEKQSFPINKEKKPIKFSKANKQTKATSSQRFFPPEKQQIQINKNTIFTISEQTTTTQLIQLPTKQLKSSRSPQQIVDSNRQIHMLEENSRVNTQQKSDSVERKSDQIEKSNIKKSEINIKQDTQKSKIIMKSPPMIKYANNNNVQQNQGSKNNENSQNFSNIYQQLLLISKQKNQLSSIIKKQKQRKLQYSISHDFHFSSPVQIKTTIHPRKKKFQNVKQIDLSINGDEQAVQGKSVMIKRIHRNFQEIAQIKNQQKNLFEELKKDLITIQQENLNKTLSSIKQKQQNYKATNTIFTQTIQQKKYQTILPRKKRSSIQSRSRSTRKSINQEALLPKTMLFELHRRKSIAY